MQLQNNTQTLFTTCFNEMSMMLLFALYQLFSAIIDRRFNKQSWIYSFNIRDLFIKYY